MNILILTRYNNDGGVVTHVINLANELKKMGHTVVVAAPSSESNDRYEALKCIHVPVDFEGKNIIKAVQKVMGLVKEYQIDIIHSHNRNTSLVAAIIKLLYQIPFVWTLHQNNIPHGFIHRLLTFPGNKTITVSSELKEFCVNKLGIENENIQIIYNGVHADKYCTCSEERCAMLKEKWHIRDEKVIVLMSRMEERKGHFRLLEALTFLKHKSGYKVLIAGNDLDDGTYRNKMLQYIADNNLSNSVEFIGYVNPVDVLNISDLFVLPSDNEGQSIAVLEAFFMKVPVIRTKSGGYQEMREFCKGIEIGDSRQLAKYIDEFLEGDLFKDETIELAYDFAHRYCTCQAMAKETEKIYKEINPIYEWAYRYMGPCVHSFCEWIRENAKASEINNILFLTREGAYIKEFMDRYDSENEFKKKVFYASRRSVLSAMSDIEWDAVVDYIRYTDSNIYEVKSIFDISAEKIESIIAQYSICVNEPLMGNEHALDILKSLESDMKEYSVQQRVLLLDYIRQMNVGGKVALVDIGWRGTMQYYLQKLVEHEGLDIEFVGLYLGEYTDTDMSCEKRGFLCSMSEQDTIPDVINASFILENALLMPINSTIRYKEENGKIVPVFDEKENNLDEKISVIQSGIKDSFESLLKVQTISSTDIEIVKRELLESLNNPTYQLACQMGDIKWKDVDTERYVAKPNSFWTYLVSPAKLIHDMRKSGWNSAFLRRVFKFPLPYFGVYKWIKRRNIS